MRYHALATDYDGTIAHDGIVDNHTLDALDRLRQSGRKLILVTGRELDDLYATFAHSDRFDWIVAENGAIIHCPGTGTVRVLTEPPPVPFINELRRLGVHPLSVGRAIVATVEPHEHTVLSVIHALGLEWHVIFNKGSVMALPSGVTKATGLVPVLTELGLKAEQVVGVGDAENDHAFLAVCGCAVAVANALPAVRDRADLVTRGSRGAGVTELIDRLLADDLDGMGRGVDWASPGINAVKESVPHS
jgi:hydroxymethylpyrimidine pyrophosphatase-like HAD family hydrolase